MTYFFVLRHSERSEESHRKTDKSYTTLTLVVGYFACAQYDVKSPIVGYADTSPTRRTRPFCRYRDISPVSAGEFTPKEEAKTHVILNGSEESHRKTEKTYTILTLVVGYFAMLNMT